MNYLIFLCKIKYIINFVQVELYSFLSLSVFLQQHLIIISITFVNIFEIFSRNLLISIYTEGAVRRDSGWRRQRKSSSALEVWDIIISFRLIMRRVSPSEIHERY